MAAHLGRTRYDPDLQMFTDAPRQPDPARLRFLRWLAERGLLEGEASAGPAGEHIGPPSERTSAGD